MIHHREFDILLNPRRPRRLVPFPLCRFLAKSFCLALCLCVHNRALALGQPQYVLSVPSPGSFTIARDATVATLCLDSNEFPGVIRAAGDLRADITRVTGHSGNLSFGDAAHPTNAILIGTIGKSRLIQQLIDAGKIDPAPIAGKWESFLVQVVQDPLPGVGRGLVIAGSDKRGTIYGIYDLSEQMGVSPWYWWADVPVRTKTPCLSSPATTCRVRPP